ncbi:PAS domain-containing protein [Streptomyces sp. MRC013]|uniref:response regulator n=1 Tax=Streptomyces sp. MRC013 TaxID=2898276 RepID=UPI002026FC39|nr:PAS domain-containing protein [Streptomyces sp. MRC013]URM90593.1 PAS domain-containing protein [Streptomyces sp. MRC013]
MSSRPSRGAARLAAILDALPDGLVLVNTNGTVVNANTIALEMFETPGTALVGRGLLDLLPSFDSRLIPGSMRRPEAVDRLGRTKPTRMVARRTDGDEFPVEVTSAGLEDGREAYDSYGPSSYSGDELLMIVVRDLSGTIDTEAELARSRRQTEMILRAASEGVVGTDTEGRIVLVNPAAAQILGWRASDLGGRELHPLMLHSRADGEPFPYDESPLADTLRSGRKHRVRGQVVWAKNGSAVPVDLTTAPVRDGDQLVGAVMTFADRRPYEQLAEEHAGRIAALEEEHAAKAAETAEKHEAEIAAYEERLADAGKRCASLAGRHAQLTAVLGESLRGPLEELRRELGTLASDPGGQLWPEANQILHHLAAGYARMTTLVDNVLGFQRLDVGEEELRKEPALLDAVVASGIDGAVELIGPGRVQFAVHAPPIEAEIDGARLATALAHLVADVAGVDSTGKARVVADGGYADSTIVVAAAQRGEVVRIEVRGPYAGGDPVHEPIVRGIVRAHGGVLQTHEVPGAGGSAYVLEVPLGAGRGADAPAAPEGDDGVAAGSGAEPATGGAGVVVLPAQQSGPGQGSAPGPDPRPGDATAGSGRRRARRASTDAFLDSPVRAEDPVAAPPTGRRRAASPEDAAGERPPAPGTGGPEPTGRRRGRPSAAEAVPAEGSVVMASESAQARPVALGSTVPPQGVAPAGDALPALPPAPVSGQAPTGRRARRALAVGQGRTGAAGEGAGRPAFALPPAEADRSPAPPSPVGRGARPVARVEEGRHDAVHAVPGADHTPPQPHPLPILPDAPVPPGTSVPPGVPGAVPPPGAPGAVPPSGAPGTRTGPGAPVPPGTTAPRSAPVPPGPSGALVPSDVPVPPATPAPDGAPVPPPAADGPPPAAGTPADAAGSTQGRAFNVRTLGQGAPFAQTNGAAQHQTPAQGTGSGSGRRRRLAAPPETGPRPAPDAASAAAPAAGGPTPAPHAAPPAHQRLAAPAAEGRAYEIGAPDEGADEGPEPLDGPGGAVEVANEPQPQPVDDELPPEPLDNPRRLLVWPAPDVVTQQALTDRGYRPVIVHSREEVDAQIAAFPAALFVDPLTGPITRTALQSLRQAAVAAGVPVLLAAGLGQATREAAYGADPAVLLKALAPRDSEQHPSRVLLIEEHDEIAHALTAALERRGMQVQRAAVDGEAVALATRLPPNLVVMDLMQVRRRRAGIIDWLRANGHLNRTPLVVYTSAGLDEADLPRLASGETVLFLAERSTNPEVQSRIVDLLAKIGTN